MKRWLQILAVAIAATTLAPAAGAQSAEAGVQVRKPRLMLVPEGMVNASAAQQYAQLKQQAAARRLLNTDAPQVQRVRSIAQRLIPHGARFNAKAAAWSWEVNVIDTPAINAFCMPGGKIVVFDGLIDRLALDDEELAAVIGHEIAHYLQRHSIDRLRDAKSKSAFGTFLAAFGLVGAIGQLATIASMYAYSREHEREADRIGVVLMNQAGYDAREAAKVWDNLLQEVSAGAGGDPSKRSPMFASHPASDERRDALLQWAGDAGGDTGEARFAERLAPLQFDLLDDELKRGQYDEALVLLDRMVARQPQRAELKYFRGETRRLRAQDGDLDQALADFEAAVRAGGEPAQTHRSMGFILRGRNQSEPARAAFARYLEKAPAAPDAGLIQSYLAETKS